MAKMMEVRSFNKSCFLQENPENGSNFMSCSLVASKSTKKGTIAVNVNFTDNNTENYRATGRVSEKGKTIFEVVDSNKLPFKIGSEVEIIVVSLEEGFFKVKQKIDNTSEDVLDFFADEVEVEKEEVVVK